MDITRVPLISDTEEHELKELTAHVLPDNPSASGRSAAEIKAALTQAFVGESAYNVVALIDRVVRDINGSLGDAEKMIEATHRPIVSVEGLEPGSDPEAVLSFKDGQMLLHFKLPKGEKGDMGVKGEQGDPFLISKTFSSVDEMNAGAATDGVLPGQYVAIDTNVEQEDSAKVYIKREDGTYGFVVDLSGKAGIQGPKGDKGDPYTLTTEDKLEIVQEATKEYVKIFGEWSLDFTGIPDSNDWIRSALAVKDGCLYAYADPWSIVDEQGLSVGEVTPMDEVPFSLATLDKAATYFVVNGVGGGESVRLVFAIQKEESASGGLEARVQGTSDYPDGLLCYWEDLTNISDTSFFVVSGLSTYSGAHAFSHTIPVSLAKAGSGYMIGTETNIQADHFAVLGATVLNVTLYVL